MKTRGFTLIEIIAVVLIMGLLTLLVFPKILNQVQSQKETVSEVSLQIIYTANQLYLIERSNEYPMTSGATYCVSLETLVSDGKLKKPLKDFTSGKEIALNQVVKTVVNTYGEGEYSLVNANECP